MPRNTQTGPTQCDLHNSVLCRFRWHQEFCAFGLFYLLVLRVSARGKILVVRVRRTLVLVAPLHRRFIVILGSELILIFYYELAPSWRGLKDFVMDGHLGRKFVGTS